MTKPLKKKPVKTTAERVGSTLTPQFPSKGGKCDHSRPCFKVVLGNKAKDTYHHFDEVGAVMFAMRHSRTLELAADVFGPDGKPICHFDRRTYDVKAYTHRLTAYNEDLLTSFERSRERNAARKEQEQQAPPKKKRLVKR